MTSLSTISSSRDETKETKQLYVPTSYFLWSEFLGISYLIEGNDAETSCKRRSYVHLIILHLYSVYQCLRSLNGILQHNNIWYNLLSLSQVTASLITVDILISRRKLLRKTFISLLDLLMEESTQNSRTPRQEEVPVIFVLTYLFLYLLIVITIVIRYKTTICSNDVIPFYNFKIKSAELIVALVFLDWVMFVIYILGILAYCILLFYIYCNKLCKLFQELNSNISSLNSEYLLKQLAMACDRLNQLTVDVDNSFGTAVFVWFALFISAICIEMNSILREEICLTYKGNSIIMTMDFIYYSSIILITCECGNRVSSSAQIIIPNIVKIARVNQLTSSSMYNDIFLLTSRQICCPAVLTAGNFFTLSRGLLLTLIGATLSYVIFLFQINSNVSKLFVNATSV
ncbi:uncharacterized protein Gr23a [Centruroides vittatus]|uniref:uncharacterized protein Gr23a n=1 Tax=Centruroides vittatus TaxID=120091 RepID=UPI0035101773